MSLMDCLEVLQVCSASWRFNKPKTSFSEGAEVFDVKLCSGMSNCIPGPKPGLDYWESSPALFLSSDFILFNKEEWSTDVRSAINSHCELVSRVS